MSVIGGRDHAVELPRVRVEPSGSSVVLVRKSASHAPVVSFLADLPIPGEVHWRDAGLVVSSRGPFPRGAPPVVEPGTVIVAADGITSLVVRNRRPGDRIRPVGLGGQKKLQDIFVDRKVPRRIRDQVPIVTAADGRIVWVAGHAIDTGFAVTDRTNTVLLLELRRM
jgi:tRNA(Ile)-lysidine synthase